MLLPVVNACLFFNPNTHNAQKKPLSNAERAFNILKPCATSYVSIAMPVMYYCTLLAFWCFCFILLTLYLIEALHFYVWCVFLMFGIVAALPPLLFPTYFQYMIFYHVITRKRWLVSLILPLGNQIHHKEPKENV